MRYALIALLFALVIVSFQPAMAAFPVKRITQHPELKKETDQNAISSSPGSQPAEPSKPIPWFGIGSLISGTTAFMIFNEAMIAMAHENIPHVAPSINTGLVFLGLCFAITAIVLGVLGLKRKRKMKGLAIAGLIWGTLISFVLLAAR